jgi:hypothetical protein
MTASCVVEKGLEKRRCFAFRSGAIPAAAIPPAPVSRQASSEAEARRANVAAEVQKTPPRLIPEG